MNKERLTRWLVSGPPLVFMVVFFVLPALIMVAASFRFPGEYGGLAPLLENGSWQFTLETYTFFFSDFIYTILLADKTSLEKLNKDLKEELDKQKGKVIIIEKIVTVVKTDTHYLIII